jgi:hypothetical protein
MKLNLLLYDYEYKNNIEYILSTNIGIDGANRNQLEK